MAEVKWGASGLITYCRRATVNSSLAAPGKFVATVIIFAAPRASPRVVPLFTF